MLRLHRSNRAERLVDALAEVVRVPLADPLVPERIVVQSRGIEQWLAMELSQRLGVWAHCRFPFPRHFVESLFDGVLGGDSAARSAFDEGALGWAIAALLPARLGDPAFEAVARYLAGATDGGRLLELSERIAGVFDDYVVYRPDLVCGWAGPGRHEDDDWQAVLFRDLVARHGSGHQAARARAFVERLGKGDAAGLPERVCVFGIATLPPLYLEVLAALGRCAEVHLFVLAPSREYFADTRLTRGDEKLDEAGGPPLLASLGRLGREFQELLEDRDYHESDEDLFVDPGSETALAVLQRDMLVLGNTSHDATRRVLAPDDRSISIHCCHGPMREVEVLHDQLVALLEDPSLEPSDIVVLAPDIESYAPYVDAVFGVTEGRPSIPYRVVRGRAHGSDEVVTAFEAVLDVLSGRLSASSVLDLLDLDVVRRRFDIGATDLDALRAWAVESGIRWGADAAHRLEVGQPALDDNTWRFGLDRMLLGVAVPGEEAALFGGRLPADVAEGGAAGLLGNLAELCARLFELRAQTAAPQPISAWRDTLSVLLDRFFDRSAGTTAALERLRAVLVELAEGAEGAGFTQAVDLATMRRRIAVSIERTPSARGFLAGGVTFCGLVPMRAVPFRVVCLLGMNDEVFPRRSTALGFDRIAADPKPGDRSAREDDRYAFLEALLSAREKLVVTYTGRGVQDNRAIPPSVVVSELLDAMREKLAPVEAGSTVEARVVVPHRLHAFSPEYFRRDGDPRLFSYARHSFDGARALGADRSDRPFFVEPLGAPEATFDLTLDELEAWLTRPIQTLCVRQLDLSLGRELEPLDDREPLELGGLTEWQVGTALLRRALEGKPLEPYWPALRASGVMPLGLPGRVAFEELGPTVLGLASAAREYFEGVPLDPLEIALEVDGVRLTGQIGNLRPSGHVHVGYSKVGRRFELQHWIRHVVLCAMLETSRRNDVPPVSIAVARRAHPVVIRFARPDSPLDVLRDLFDLVRSARRAPLPLFLRASREYARRVVDPSTEVDRTDIPYALRKAEQEFTNPTQGDRTDRHVALAFDRFDLACAAQPVGFVEATERFYAPFFRCRTEA